MSTSVRQTKSCAFSLPILAARSRQYRAHAKDCNHCPRHPRSVRPMHEDAASALVSMKPVWNGCVPINTLQPTKKPCASVRCLWNPNVQRGNTGMTDMRRFLLWRHGLDQLWGVDASSRATSEAPASKASLRTAYVSSRSHVFLLFCYVLVVYVSFFGVAAFFFADELRLLTIDEGIPFHFPDEL
jgi:hypothetical protein